MPSHEPERGGAARFLTAADRAAITRPIRIEPAFADRKFVRNLFDRHAPYRALAAYLPDGSDESAESGPRDAVYPWFRGNWAVDGRVLADGADYILYNPHFLAAAQALFPSAGIVPKLLVVNVNVPMPAGVVHLDVPAFRGVDRDDIAPRLLLAMGASGLFERWRATQVGAIAWFYDGPGGGFDYWPDGAQGSMETERAPFGNVAIVAESDSLYHRVGRIGPANAVLPQMTESAEIRLDPDGAWSIFDKNECRGRYPREAVRLSLVWKAEVRDEGSSALEVDPLTTPRIFQILQRDLRRRGAPLAGNHESLQDREWIEHVCRLYMRPATARGPCAQ